MPVYLKHSQLLCGSAVADMRHAPKNCINVGIINNMPDGALKSTERQFLNLLNTAAGALALRVTFYGLPEVLRSDSGRRHMDGFYCNIQDLWDHPLDGLIVTGAEPRTPNLPDERYWTKLTELVEWAEQNTHSSLWSCLAAHAAVLHLDGIQRHRLRHKRFGLFSCSQASEHRLLDGVSARLIMPHSRWNELSEADLNKCGYQVLTRSEQAGVDAFVKQRKSPLVFFQGHPEYDANTLLLEYRRDIGRYLRGEVEAYPVMPRSYFDSQTEVAFTALRERALSDRREGLLEDFSPALLENKLQNTWRSAALGIYQNWLAFLADRKQQRVITRRPQQQAAPAELVHRRTFAAGAD